MNQIQPIARAALAPFAPKPVPCDGCGAHIAPEFLKAATDAPPDCTPEVFRKRETFFFCELCRTEGDEA
jgi:hypothetical protein